MFISRKFSPTFIVAAILWFAAVYFFQDPGWNGNSRLDLTRSIVEQGSLQIDAYRSQKDWATEDVASFAGHYYSDKAPGSAVLAVPLYYLLYKSSIALAVALSSVFVKHMLTSAVLGSAFTLNGVCMYLMARRITANAEKALTAALAVALGTMLWPYSAVYYGHVLAGAFLMLAFYLLFSMRHTSRSASLAGFAAAGLAMGLAFISEYTTALLIPVLILYAVYVLRGEKLASIARLGLAGSLAAAIPLALVFAYNAAAFSNPLALGYSFEASNTFQEGMSQGFMGIHHPSLGVLYHITLDPRFGLFWLSPVLLLAPIGFLAALRNTEYRSEGLLSLYCLGAMLAMNAGYYLWWGGNAFGPRLIIPALPFFIVPLASLPDKWLRPTIVLAAVSAMQMLIPLMGEVQPSLVFRPRFDAFFLGNNQQFSGLSILYQYGLPNIVHRLQEGRPSWTLGAAAGLPYWLSPILLILVESALVLVHHRVAASDRPDR